MELWIHRLKIGRAKDGNLKERVFCSVFECMQVQHPFSSFSLLLHNTIDSLVFQSPKTLGISKSRGKKGVLKMSVYMFIHAQVCTVTYESLLLGNGNFCSHLWERSHTAVLVIVLFRDILAKAWKPQQ